MISIKVFEEIYNLIPAEPEFELRFDKGSTYVQACQETDRLPKTELHHQ